MTKDKEKIVKDMQQVVAQMKIDDIEENPDSEYMMFDCSSCGEQKALAGSIQYSKYRLCNDCVLLYELGLKLNKIKNIEEFIKLTEDKRLEAICRFIKKEADRENN